MPHLYEVGKLYSQKGKTRWDEHVEYNFLAKAHELRLFYKSPSEKEIENVRTGVAQFALYPYLDVIFFCFKFGDDPWSDSVSSIHLIPEDERMLPDDVDNAQERGLLHTFLVDADTGILKAMRVVSFSAQFSRAMNAAIWQQHERPFPSDTEYNAQAQRIYNQYSSSQIANKLAIIRCKGGD